MFMNTDNTYCTFTIVTEESFGLIVNLVEWYFNFNIDQDFYRRY